MFKVSGVWRIFICFAAESSVDEKLTVTFNNRLLWKDVLTKSS